MSKKITTEEFNAFLKKLIPDYKIYAPKRLEKRGRFSDTDLIKYAEITTLEEIEYKEKSNFSPKEVIFPASQPVFYFTEEEMRVPKINEKGIVIFLRPCDINGIERLDGIFLRNGSVEDPYYKRLREKVKYIMIECAESF